MKDTLVMITVGDLAEYVSQREQEAKLEIVNDHIRPFSANKARKVISLIKKRKNEPVRKSSSPRELTVRVVKSTKDFDTNEITQYLVR